MISRSQLRLSVAVVAWVLPLGLAFFPRAEHSQPASKPLQRLKIAFVTNNASDYWMVAKRGIEKAERELGINVDYRIPASGTAAEQTQVINDLLAKGTQGIAISPIDPDGETALLNRAAAKSLLFTQDTDAPQSKRACYIGIDNVAAGRQAGEQLKRVLPRGGDIMIFVGQSDTPNATDRIRGLKQVLQGTNIKVLGVRNDDADRAKAKQNASEALAKHPHLAACVGIWSYNGPTILSALQDAHKTGKVKIVCFDEEDDTLNGIAHGQISASIVGQPFEIGYLSIISMAKVLGGDKSVIPVSKQLFVPTLAIERNNVDAFKKNLHQMLEVRDNDFAENDAAGGL